MSTGRNLRTIGKENMEKVLKLLTMEKSLTRKELANRLGLSKMTITNIVNQLMEKGYVSESPMERTALCNGPVPMAVSIVPNSFITIGVHISSTDSTVQLLDLVDGVLYEAQVTVDNMDSNQELVRSIKDMIHTLFRERREYADHIVGIGVTYSGAIDYMKGSIRFSANQFEKEEINIKSYLEKAFSLPVVVASETRGAAIAELVFGKLLGPEKIYYINSGKEIRGGFIHNNLLRSGTYGAPGELGHMTVKYDGKLCVCGARGCYHLYAATSILLERSKCHSIEELQLKIQERDPLALRIIEEYIQVTTAVFTNVVNIYDPAYLLIGGEITKLDNSIFRKIEKLLNERIVHRKDRYVRVLVSTLHRRANTMGAGLAVYETLFMSRQ